MEVGGLEDAGLPKPKWGVAYVIQTPRNTRAEAANQHETQSGPATDAITLRGSELQKIQQSSYWQPHPLYKNDGMEKRIRIHLIQTTQVKWEAAIQARQAQTKRGGRGYTHSPAPDCFDSPSPAQLTFTST